MFRYSSIAFVVASSMLTLGCQQTAVVRTDSVNVEFDDTVDFNQFDTFSVLTSNIVPPDKLPDLDEDQVAFNEMVNQLIIEAMQAEPVCMTLIDPEDVTDENQPDLWAANGLGRTTDGGYYYECVPGWWWGYWGWYWDPCASWYPVYVEYDVGNLLIPVGPPPAVGEEPKPIFAGLAQSVIGTGADLQTKAEQAVTAIFQDWPVKRQCSTP